LTESENEPGKDIIGKGGKKGELSYTESETEYRTG
jgi:hypothetical protein